jgi:hypothetical protein
MGEGMSRHLVPLIDGANILRLILVQADGSTFKFNRVLLPKMIAKLKQEVKELKSKEV